MKKGLVVIVVLVLAVVGGYVGVGMKAESKVKSLVGELNQAMLAAGKSSGQPYQMQLSLRDYKKGLFSGKANLSLSVKPFLPRYDIPMTIYYGPYVLSKAKFGWAYAQAVLALPKSLQTQFQSMTESGSTEPELLIGLLPDFNDNGEFDISVPEFNIIAKGGKGQLNWKGFESVWAIKASATVLDGYTNFDGLTFKSRQANADVGTLRADYNMKESPEGLWVGHYSLDFASADVSSIGRKIFALNTLSVESDSDSENGLLQNASSLKLQSLTFMNKKFGPAEIQTNIKNIDSKALVKLTSQLQALNTPGITPAEQKQKLMAMLPDVTQLANKGAEVEVSKFNIQLPQGAIDAKAKITVTKGADLSTVEAVMKNLQVNAQAEVPVSLVKKILSANIRRKLFRQQMSQQIAAQQQLQTAISSNGQTSADGSTDNQKADDTHASTKVLSRAEIKEMADKQTDAQLDSLVQAKFLTKKDDSYTTTFKFENGQMIVNGQTLGSPVD